LARSTRLEENEPDEGETTLKKLALLVSVASFVMAGAASAQETARASQKNAVASKAAEGAAAPKRETFSTGVAKARDLLDSAISTSSLDENDILKFSPRSVSDLLRDLPGVRADASQGEGYGNISIRGLPIAATGSKYVQLQEDGLPVMEFGDTPFATADTFVRLDSNIGQVQAIRGGSASTFASNSPGGVINFISKTGVEAGGSIQTTFGVNYRSNRVDFDYGAPLSDTLRFHVGGFYRSGEGIRRTGYDGQDGGQIKFNVTKDFDGGYIRFYGKYLNDKTPVYGYVPVKVSGTDASPTYSSFPGFDIKRDSVLTRNIAGLIGLDSNNNLSRQDVREGMHAVVKSVGFEAKFDVSGWSVTNRFRYSGMTGGFVSPEFVQVSSAPNVMGRVGGFGGTLSYATGPRAGQAITDPSTLNGNGLLIPLTFANVRYNSLDNVTNDLRASRSWKVGDGELTATGGFYKARQTIDLSYLWGSVVQDVLGDGNASLINVTSRTGVPITQGGFYGFGAALLGNGCCRERRDARYDVNAPYASINYHLGKLAVGGSVRYDKGSAKGVQTFGIGATSYDINGDGVISSAESRTSRLNFASNGLIDYSYDTLSYSVSANYRVAQSFSVFGRYSRGGRANADRIYSVQFINSADGSLLNDSTAVDPVRQAEGGFKYRTDSTMLNLTAFWAEAMDSNLDPRNGAPIRRLFRAKGLEFEGSYTRGIFSVAAGATYTDAKIAKDTLNPVITGKTPQNQADFVFQVTPQINIDRYSIGAVLIGTTGSYSTVENSLRIPGYVTTNAFAQARVAKNLLVSLNAANLMNVKAITGVADATIPTTGVVQARVLAGRTISAALRYDF
jgi:outer membrane receptor protein involved in Fe transport